MKTGLFFTDKEIDFLLEATKNHEKENYDSMDDETQLRVNQLIETLEARGVEEIVTPKKKFARKCSQCSKLMNEGYCVLGGCEYYCSDKCLHENISKEDWEENYYSEGGDSYWTTWEDESEFNYYEDGTEIEE